MGAQEDDQHSRQTMSIDINTYEVIARTPSNRFFTQYSPQPTRSSARTNNVNRTSNMSAFTQQQQLIQCTSEPLTPVSYPTDIVAPSAPMVQPPLQEVIVQGTPVEQ